MYGSEICRLDSVVFRRKDCCALPSAGVRQTLKGVPEEFSSANGGPGLVILNDLLNDVYSKQVCELFT